MEIKNREFSSYKDTDAFVFFEEGKIRRYIAKNYLKTFDSIVSSGLYDDLIQKGLLISHQVIEKTSEYYIIEPENVLITYPWEWCFSALKEAATATLKIQLIALEKGFSLKDANCYNIQFKDGKALLIDTTSFEKYKENSPWCAYKQFCENFLAPLLLCANCDYSFIRNLLLFPHGIPLDYTLKLLPPAKIFNFGIFNHIFLHQKMQTKFNNDTKMPLNNLGISKNKLTNLIKNLLETVENIKLKKQKTEWQDYYSNTNYTKEAFESKKEIVRKYKDIVQPSFVADFGANTGEFSRIFLNKNTNILSLDVDFLAVEKNWQKMKENDEKTILPLVFDITNPSPSVGFSNLERVELKKRIKKIDLALALALIHHLRFTYNIPFSYITKYFSSMTDFLAIEYVDKSDSKVEFMLKNRKDVFSDYTQENFEKEFSSYFKIISKDVISQDKRTMYLMKKVN